MVGQVTCLEAEDVDVPAETVSIRVYFITILAQERSHSINLGTRRSHSTILAQERSYFTILAQERISLHFGTRIGHFIAVLVQELDAFFFI